MIKEEFLQRIGLITTDVFTSSINKTALMEYTAEQIQATLSLIGIASTAIQPRPWSNEQH